MPKKSRLGLIVIALTIVAALLSVYLLRDVLFRSNYSTVPTYAAQTTTVVEMVGEDLVYWIDSDICYHVYLDCSDINGKTLNSGTVEQAMSQESMLGLCTTCARTYDRIRYPETNPDTFAAQMSAADIDDLLLTFYTFYVDCVNSQSTSPMPDTCTTPLMNAEIAHRLTLSGNINNEFLALGAYCDAAHILAGASEDGYPLIIVNATFHYSFRARGSGEAFKDSSNHQTVELIYVDGNWKVNRMIMVSDSDFAIGAYGDLSKSGTAR